MRYMYIRSVVRWPRYWLFYNSLFFKCYETGRKDSIVTHLLLHCINKESKGIFSSVSE